MARAPQVCTFVEAFAVVVCMLSFLSSCSLSSTTTSSDSITPIPVSLYIFGLAIQLLSQLFTGAICQIIPVSNCRAYFRNFYFNLTTNKCEPIIAGGCHPSGWNGFTTMEDCNRTCSGKVKY